MNAPHPEQVAGTIEYSDMARLPSSPVVSVLMLTYNHHDSVAQAIESVVLQETDFPVELLVGEDCSTDGSRGIILDYQARYPGIVRVLMADRNVGAYRNYLRLLTAARGEFFAQLDGDDYWLPGKLARQVALLRENPGYVAVYANAFTIDGEGRKMGLFNNVTDRTFDLPALLRRGNFLNTSTLVYRSELALPLARIGHEFIDFQLHLALAQNGLLRHIGEPLAAYRVNSPGSMVACANDRTRELYWQAIMSVPRELVVDDDMTRGIADFLRRVAFRSLSTRDLSLSRAWWSRAVAAAPCGAAKLGWLTVAAMMRQARLALCGALPRLWGGSTAHVLYRR